MQPTSRPPQLILTGGTLSASRNADGLLTPSADSLNAALKRVGFDPDTAVRPYIIDSIDFDIGAHYPKLFAAALTALENGKTPVVCGGTDTLAWYSALLTKDLMRHGKLQPGSHEKIIFLSSMHGIEEAPAHVEKILAAGKLLAEKPLSGGFAVCAENDDAKSMAVHDVLHHFDKVSSSRISPFRSAVPTGYIIGRNFSLNEAYAPPAAPEETSLRHYARIAPPLLPGHDSEALLAYLKTLGGAIPPYDGVVIEGGAPHGRWLHRHDQTPLVEMVRQLTHQGTRVVFCNPVRFDDHTLTMHPVNGPAHGQLITDMERAGARFVTGQPKDVYLDLMLTTPPRPEYRSSPPSAGRLRRQKVLGVRYVPDSDVMQQTIHALAPQAKNFVFAALLNNVLPNYVARVLKEHGAHTNFISGFEYNGSHFVTPEGTEDVQRPQGNEYQAGQEVKNLVKPYTGEMATLVQRIFAALNRGHLPTNTDRASSDNSARSP